MSARRPRGVVVALAVAVLLAITVGSASARLRLSGPGCPGNPDELIAAAEDGDVLVPMYEEEFGRNTNSQLITADIEIEGGWVDPSGNFNCGGDADGLLDVRANLIAAGFQYDPTKHSGLTAFDESVLRLDDDVKSFTARNLDVMQDGTATGNGGGLTVAGSTQNPRLSSATITLENVAVKPNYFAGTVGASGNGGGLYLDLDGGSRLTIRDSAIRQYRASGSGGGFYFIVRGGSSVLIERTAVQNNSAATCGGGRIILHSGTVTISDSSFSGNTAGGQPSGLCVERAVGATGPAAVYLRGVTFAGGAGITASGNVVVYDEVVFLPLLRQ